MSFSDELKFRLVLINLFFAIVDAITNFVIAGHYRKSGEIIIDNVEGILIEDSREFLHVTNLFGGNVFMERAGNAILNQNIQLFSRPAIVQLLKVGTKDLIKISNEIFSNFSKTDFESYFPPNHESNDGMNVKNGIDLSFSKSFKSSHMSHIDNTSTLKNRIDILHLFMKILGIIIILSILMAFWNYFIFKRKYSKLKDKINRKTASTSEKLIN